MNAMANILAVFESYPGAHRAAQALASAGHAARVSYLLGAGDQSADGMEGFCPGLTEAQERGAGTVLGDEAEGRPFSGPTAGRFAVTGTDSLTASEPLADRLIRLGLAPADIHRLLGEVDRGRVAAVFRTDGPAEPAMAVLAAHGALHVEQLF